jgi:hypothetical protein
MNHQQFRRKISYHAEAYAPSGADVGHFSFLRSKVQDESLLRAALQNLEIPIQNHGEVRGSNGLTHPADIVVILEGRFDLGFTCTETGYFDLVADLWGLSKIYDQTALINAIYQEYDRLQAQAESSKRS